MGIFRKIGDWFYNKVDEHMYNSAPRKANKKESAKTKEMLAKYKKWAGLPGGTTDKNKDEDVE